jgi:hypothetical protein
MFFKERKVAFRFEFGDGKGLAREREEVHGYVLWKKTTF